MSNITEAQLNTISIIERCCSTISFVGSVFIISTFCFTHSFHKPVNRILFYASFGNLMTNVITWMARSVLTDPTSAACQFQGFLVQVFMPADAIWALAMAINVYLTFYHQFDARKLRRMEIPYIIMCYGLPTIVGFIYIFITDKNGNKIYGNAGLWCWVSTEWNALRMATCYIPIWLIIFLVLAIYIRAGRTIHEKRKQLRKLESSNPDSRAAPEEGGVGKTFEVQIDSEAGNMGEYQLENLGNPSSVIHGSSTSPDAIQPTQNPSMPPLTITQSEHDRKIRKRSYDLNKATLAYAKCSALFCFVILVVWIPPSANRVYQLVHDNEASLTLEYISAFVLGLQGFWNALVYVIISWEACKTLVSDFRFDRRPVVTELVINRIVQSAEKDRAGSPRRDRNRLDDSESTRELASPSRVASTNS